MRSASFSTKVMPLTSSLSECGAYLIPYLLSNALLVAFYFAASSGSFARSGGFLMLLIANSCGIPISVLFFAKLGLLWKLSSTLGPLFALGTLFVIFNFWVAALRLLIGAAQSPSTLKSHAESPTFLSGPLSLLVIAATTAATLLTFDLTLVAALVN